MTSPPVRAVFWDFGGVVLSSPFDAFNRYEDEAGIPRDTIRRLNATNPDRNAWAHFERNDVDTAGFARLFEEEAAAAGFTIDATRVLASLDGEVRPQMVEALRRLKDGGFGLALLTNNVRPMEDRAAGGRAEQIASIVAMFDVVVESSVVGVRKPEPRFYELALEKMNVRADETVFLDDLGINLKPAAAMGMRTIKVTDPDVALGELEGVVGIGLR
jgi:putative hydrolase of the HAD superfamily